MRLKEGCWLPKVTLLCGGRTKLRSDALIHARVDLLDTNQRMLTWKMLCLLNQHIRIGHLLCIRQCAGACVCKGGCDKVSHCEACSFWGVRHITRGITVNCVKCYEGSFLEYWKITEVGLSKQFSAMHLSCPSKSLNISSKAAVERAYAT